ncbi:MAG: hypothetical protein K1X86_09790 [Ignavibacteria bacterium]|nr:hypothetical protein [Ignavibacteria bacterium]
MKKTLLFLFSLILFSNFYSNSFSQSFGIGYRVGSASIKPLDFIIDRYNNTRTAILTKNMDKITSLSGPVYSVGFNIGLTGFDIEIPNLKSNTVTAETSSQIRELYMKLSGFEINFAYGKPAFENKEFMGFIGGFLSVDKVDPTIYTRVYNKNSTAPDFTQVNVGGPVNIGVGPYVSAHLFFPSFIIFGEVKPFYKFSLVGADFYDANIVLNPNTWYKDDVEATKGSLNYFGVNAKVGITVALF